jgi:hypothetical protein
MGVESVVIGTRLKPFQNSLGILLPKLFWPTVRKNCSSDRKKLLKFEAEGREFAKFLRSLEQFIQTVKGQNNFLVTECVFLLVLGGFSDLIN